MRILSRSVLSVVVSSVTCATVLLMVSAPAAFSKEPPAKKPWTFLVYLNAFNNLDRYGFLDMNEMETVGSTDQINVVSQWASYKQGDVRRVLVQKDNDPKNVTSPVVENIGRVDMGDYRTFVDFVKWGKENYPAEHYFIAIWNHGNGWHRFNPNAAGDGSLHSTDLSYDDFSGNHMTTEQLGLALSQSKELLGQKVDIYGSDACLMAMAEVAGEMKDSVAVSVGSQETEPGDGWPYDTILKDWNAVPNASPRQVAEIVTRNYLKSYEGDSGITFSAFDFTKYDAMASSVRGLRDSIVGADASARAKLLKAAQASLSFTDSDYRDLGMFVAKLRSSTTEAEVSRAALSGVQKAIGDFVIANGSSNDEAGATGLSFWLPVYSSTYSSYAERYGKLVFNADSGWGEAAKTIVTK